MAVEEDGTAFNVRRGIENDKEKVREIKGNRGKKEQYRIIGKAYEKYCQISHQKLEKLPPSHGGVE